MKIPPPSPIKMNRILVLLFTLNYLALGFSQELDYEDLYQHHLDQEEEYHVQDEILSETSNLGQRKQLLDKKTSFYSTGQTCGPCIKEECASPSGCLAGIMPDRCGCCQVCARSEGELCDTHPSENNFGVCGENLDCKRRHDVPQGEGEYVCQCQIDKMVCGSDATTYSTICELNEEAMRRGKPDKFNPQLIIEYWGPCKEAPVIISPPSDSYGPLGANLTLDCEARGYPAPEISWKFVSAKGETVSLPNDDQSVSIQMRGGPEPLMVTGWAQIMSLDPSYSGIYHCIATNTEGQVYSMASVGVYKNEF